MCESVSQRKITPCSAILHQKSILGLKVFTPFKVARVFFREYSSSDKL